MNSLVPSYLWLRLKLTVPRAAGPSQLWSGPAHVHHVNMHRLDKLDNLRPLRLRLGHSIHFTNAVSFGYLREKWKIASNRSSLLLVITSLTLPLLVCRQRCIVHTGSRRTSERHLQCCPYTVGRPQATTHPLRHATSAFSRGSTAVVWETRIKKY